MKIFKAKQFSGNHVAPALNMKAGRALFWVAHFKYHGRKPVGIYLVIGCTAFVCYVFVQ